MTQQSSITDNAHREAHVARCRDRQLQMKARRQATARRAAEDHLDGKRLKSELNWLNDL